MNQEQFRKRLLDMEGDLSARIGRATREARDGVDDSPRDSGDSSVANIAASDHFTEAELDGTVLEQVRDALKRIDDGTFGNCTVDGKPIEPKRLQAVPWTPYCLEHQDLLEAQSRS